MGHHTHYQAVDHAGITDSVFSFRSVIYKDATLKMLSNNFTHITLITINFAHP